MSSERGWKRLSRFWLGKYFSALAFPLGSTWWSSDHWLAVTISENLQAEHFGLKLNNLEVVIKGSSEESSEKIQCR